MGGQVSVEGDSVASFIFKGWRWILESVSVELFFCQHYRLYKPLEVFFIFKKEVE